jgi:hypothetical protein
MGPARQTRRSALQWNSDEAAAEPSLQEMVTQVVGLDVVAQTNAVVDAVLGDTPRLYCRGPAATTLSKAALFGAETKVGAELGKLVTGVKEVGTDLVSGVKEVSSTVVTGVKEVGKEMGAGVVGSAAVMSQSIKSALGKTSA